MERGMSEEEIVAIGAFSKVFPLKSAKEITEDLNKAGMRVTEEYVKEAWRLEGESVVKDLSLEEELEREFDMKYKDPNGAAKYVVDYIDLCFDTWKGRRSTWYAPCTAIVQSSGWGKSRLIKEIALAPEMPVVFYFSLMKPAHKGYPKTDPDLYMLLRSITSHEEGYALITACFDWYSNSRGRLGKEEIYKRHQRKEYGEVIECMKERGVSLGNKEKNQCNCTEDAMNSAGQKAMADLKKDGFGRKGVCFLFVFDEARNLLERPYYCIRRAFKELVSDVKAFLMVIDTKKVSTFMPAGTGAVADSSSRVVTCLNKLFPPLCRLPTFDVVSFDAASSTQKQGLEDIFSPESLYRQGRPLWYARHKLNLQELLDLALQKLMGGVSPDTSEGKSFLEENPIAPVALLGRRIAVDVCPQSRMSEEIVASHMGVCLHVSASREHVLSATLPEPVLSDAVAKFYRERRNYLKKHLSKLNGQLLIGMVIAGERDELIARFLILEAMDALQKEAGKDSTTPVKLMHLLAKLFRDFQPGSFPHLRELLDAEIFFNAFHRFHGKPSRNDIRTFLRKCAAMICERNQKAFDLYIPYVLPSKGVADNLLDDGCIGCVGIQIKNRKKIAKIDSTTMYMKKHRDDIKNYDGGEVAPGLLILMHMSTKKKKTGKPIGCQVYNETLVVRGLDDLIIEDDVKVAVDELLVDTPDPLKVLELEFKDMSKSDAYLPLFTRKAIDSEKQALKDILQSVRNDPPRGADTSVPGADTSVPSAKKRKL